MHTSWPIFILWLCGVAFAASSQTVNYFSTPRKDRTRLRHLGFGLGILATILAGTAAWKAATDWSALPMTTEGLSVGELWDDGGVPAIMESDERRAKMERRSH